MMVGSWSAGFVQYTVYFCSCNKFDYRHGGAKIFRLNFFLFLNYWVYVSDWLDNGNNKKAVQEAEKVLKKTPNLQAAKALKALALLRLGKSGEATTVLDALTAERPCDDTTLQAMTISYRESQQCTCTLIPLFTISMIISRYFIRTYLSKQTNGTLNLFNIHSFL